MASISDKLYVTYVDFDRDLLKIWGQRNRIGGTYIERLLLQLLPEFSQTVGPNPNRIHKGMFCFAKYTDDNYYRARVISRVQGDSVCVLFVDYGNRDTIKVSDIRIQDGKEGDVLMKMSEQAEDYYLARVAAPPSGWTREILSEIRRDICCDEFHYKVVDQVGDQKILDVQFRNEDFSNYLAKKQLARPLPLPVQREMILSYCSLVSNDVKRDDTFKDTPPRVPFPTSLPPPGLKAPPKPLNIASDINMQLNFAKPNIPMNFSCPPPPVHYPHSRQIRAPFQQVEANIPKNSFYHPVGHTNNQIPIDPVSVQPVNPNMNPLLSQQLSQFYQIQENMDSYINNNNNNNNSNKTIIELLAQQVKQYIAKDNAKTETETEETPHHYVNSVLEVGNTYNVLISHIDDGPWSFSIQLLSSEIELQKLMDELSSVELVPIKPPIILGSPCIGSSALYGNLCRGVVVSISRSAVKVYFVDFGNTEDLPASSIYELPPKFFKTRVLSQKFCLSGLQKVAYSDDIKKFFREVVQDGLLILRVTSLEADNLPTCELYLKERNIKRILNEKMQKLRSAVLEDLPKVGDTENVLVTWVVSPQKFFVQLSKRDTDLNSLKKELEAVETKGQPLTYQQLSVGFKCVCQYASDGHWYRAVITSVDSEEAISVFYIDYGNTETVSISRLRKVDGSGLINQMSNQALQCCLKGFESHPFDEELTKMLESLTLEKELQMTVASSEKQLLCVKLFDKGNDISLMLTIMKTEEAKKKKEMESINYSPGSAWDSSESGIVTSRSRSEKDNKSQMEDSFEQNNRNFSGGQNNRNFSNDLNNRNFSGDSNNRNFFGDQNNRNFSGDQNYRHFSGDQNNRNFSGDQNNRNFSGDQNYRHFSGDQNNRNFFGDQNRKKNKNWKGNFQSLRSPPRANHSRLKTRFEDRRDTRSTFQERDEQQRGWKNRAPKEFGNWDPIDIAPSRGPARGRDESYNNAKASGGRGFGQSRNRTGRDDRRTNGYGENKFGNDRRREYENREGKRFGNNRGWDSFGGGEERKKFNDRGDKFDEKKSTRVPVKREDMAPPGSKFEEKEIEIGSCEKGIVTYYFSPDEFFVQLLAQEEEFKKMMKDIQHYYSDKYSIRDPVKAGDIVIAQFSHDKILYRAQVIKPSPVTVKYIDYGNQEPVQPKGIWFVAKQFLQLPQQVIKCRLSGVQPLASDWPPPGSGVDKFFEFEEYKCTFLRKEGDMYEISMEASENGKDVASEIVAAGLARPLCPELDVPETDYSLLPNQILRLFVCHVDSPSQFYVVLNPKASELIAEAISAINDPKGSLSPLDWSKLEPEMPCLATTDGASWYRGNIIKSEGNNALVWLCDRGDSVDIPKDKIMNIPDYLKAFQPQAVQCSLQGVPRVEDEEDFRGRVECKSHLVHILSAADKRLSVILYDEEGLLYDFENDCDVAKTIEPLGQLPLLSQSFPLLVSHLESVGEVYIQRIIDEGDLLNFLEQINQFYEGEGGDWQEDEDIPPGTLVAAKSITYDSWYRGRVKASAEGRWKVAYIDYGNKEILPRENLKKLDSSFLGMNAFCKAVALDGCFDGETAKEIQRKFWDVCADKDLVGHLRNDGGKLLVELRVNGERVTDLLKLVASNSTDENVEIATDLPDNVENEFINATEANSGVFVSHIDSPNRFWVHKEAIVDELEQFQSRLEKGCEDRPDKTEASVGDIVAAAFSNRWYRARVIEADGEHLKVQFIDYGNTAIVDSSSGAVKELAPELIDVPVFAMRFTLKGFWSEKAGSKFTEIILRNENPLSLTVLEEGDPPVVDLFQNGRSVTQMLEEEVGSEVEHDSELPTVYIIHSTSPLDFYIQRESSTDVLRELLDRLLDAPNFENSSSVEKDKLYAAKYPEDGAWYRARVLDSSGEDITVRFVDYGNISTVSEVKCLPSALVDIPVLSENCSLVYGKHCDSWSDAACEMFAEYADGRPLKMKVILKRGERAIVRLFHEYKSVSEELEPLCKKDGRKEMYVSHAVSPTEFYIQHVNDEQYKQIAEALNNGDGCDELEERERGAVCQVCLPEDGCWYRGKILRDLGEEGCEVLLIDFGFVGVAKELRKLPPEIRNIPPRALKCSLDLEDAEVTKSAKEEFVNLTAAGAAVFRGRIISPGETNIVSLKLDGRIIEETLELGPKKTLTNGHRISPEETELGKEIREEPEGVPEQPEGALGKVSADPVSAFSQSQTTRNKVHKIVPGCISRGEEETTPKEETAKVSFRKLKFSEKVVPGSVSRGISLESMAEEQEEVEVAQDRQVTKSAPNTPRPLRKSEYVKTDVDDRLVPGCISTGIPLCCSPMSEKKAQSEKIVPGAVNGNQ